MPLFRWIALVSGIIFLLIAWLKGETREAIIAFVLGMFCGAILDYWGVKIKKLWRYPRQPFLGIKYFTVVVPAWGVFGMTANLVWDWYRQVGTTWLIFLSLTMLFFILYEIPNIKTKSWEYSTPWWLVGLGWLPLILFFRVTYLAIR